MNECRVASSVRSLDLDVSLDHLNANVGCRYRCYGCGNARAHQEGCKIAPCEVSGMRLVARLGFLVVCHSFFVQVFRAKEFIAFRWQTARRVIVYTYSSTQGPLWNLPGTKEKTGSTSESTASASKRPA